MLHANMHSSMIVINFMASSQFTSSGRRAKERKAGDGLVIMSMGLPVYTAKLQAYWGRNFHKDRIVVCDACSRSFAGTLVLVRALLILVRTGTTSP